MKVLQVIPNISREASGPSYSVPRLCQALAEAGYDVRLRCVGASRIVGGVDVRAYPEWPFLRRFAISSRFALAVSAEARDVDVVHNHSLWSMTNVATGLLVPGKGAKLVVSPRGTLSEWALNRSRTTKWLMWPFQRPVLSRADLLHATSVAEYVSIRSRGLSQPVAIIPNGIDIPETVAPRGAADTRALLFLSRLHPGKGLELLLDAWNSLHRSFPAWELRIVGPGRPDYVRTLHARIADLHLPRVVIAGPVYGERKSACYQAADLFVLPSSSENFGMVVAEALAHGCPAVVSQGAPWSALDAEGCGWWIEGSVEALSTTLYDAMRLPQGSLSRMGLLGRDWMEREFSWPRVAEQMSHAYKWVVRGGELPGSVRTV